jgi:hypothetical protein
LQQIWRLVLNIFGGDEMLKACLVSLAFHAAPPNS